MNKTKQTFIFGFALFASFFGAGNLILPPMLGYNSGSDWWLVALGFVITATVIPLLALFGHAKLQGSMLEFGNKVSPLFSLIFCLFTFVIIIALPCPRTAAVTHEMAIAPFFNISSLSTSVVYFSLAFIFVINRNSVLDILGKYLTPIIVIIILLIIVLGLYYAPSTINGSKYKSPLINGLLEGYQTYDAIAGLVTGGIIIISINGSKNNLTFNEKKQIIAKSGIIAMIGLFIIYAGLISIGAFYNTEFSEPITRTSLLAGLAEKTLGNFGAVFLSVLVSLACFTTAVSIIVCTADFFKILFNENQWVYNLTAFICCSIGVIIGQLNVAYIINLALPTLMLIYPIAIVLILLNVLPNRFASQLVFKSVIIVAFIFSLPDFLQYILPEESLKNIIDIIPLGKNNLGWVMPSILVFIFMNVFKTKKPN